VKAILGIFFFVIFGLIGMRVAGELSTALIGTRTFESPDGVAQFNLYANLGISLLFALLGLVIGILLAGRFKGRLIRKEP
jgi:hypothetical protein